MIADLVLPGGYSAEIIRLVEENTNRGVLFYRTPAKAEHYPFEASFE